MTRGTFCFLICFSVLLLHYACFSCFYGTAIVELFSQDIHVNSQLVWDTMVDGVMVFMVLMVSHGIGLTGSISILFTHPSA